MNIRSASVTLVAAVAMTVASLGYAIPALAKPASVPADTCLSNRTCVYDHGKDDPGGSYTGLLGYRSPGVPLANITSANRNRLSSWINTSGTNARFYYGLGGHGTCVTMFAHDSASASSDNPDNNQAESHGYDHGC